MESSRSARAIQLATIMALNLVVFALVLSSGGFLRGDLLEPVWEPNSVMISLAAPALSFAVTGLIPPSWKAVLVFWKIRNPLPGNRAFSEFVHHDPRFEVRQLSKWMPFPTGPAEQNRLWYRIYKGVAAAPSVSGAQDAFLLTRDASAAAFLLIFTMSPAAYLLAGRAAALPIAILLVVEFLLFAVSARNHGNRFVCNVLAEEAFTSVRPQVEV